MTALSLVAASLLALASPLRQVSSEAAFVIVVNAANRETAADAEKLTAIFLKQRKKWSNGEPILPVDQSLASQVRSGFTSVVFGQQSSAIQTYWQGEVGGGREMPPPVRSSDEDVLSFVAAHPGAIGYVSSAAQLPAKVKLLRLER